LRPARPSSLSRNSLVALSTRTMQMAECASDLVDRAAWHLRSLPHTVTHKAKERAVELAKTDVLDARDLLDRLESALAQL